MKQESNVELLEESVEVEERAKREVKEVCMYVLCMESEGSSSSQGRIPHEASIIYLKGRQVQFGITVIIHHNRKVDKPSVQEVSIRSGACLPGEWRGRKSISAPNDPCLVVRIRPSPRFHGLRFARNTIHNTSVHCVN